MAGQEPIVELLPAIREYNTPWLAERDIDPERCVMCQDPECGGACPAAMYVVRQVLEALDEPDDFAWWREELNVTSLKERVAALADGIAIGTADFMAGFERAGEGLSTRMSGETAAMVVQVRAEMEAYVRGLLK